MEVHYTDVPHRIRIPVAREARHIANLLREGDPPIWVNDATGQSLVLDLRNLTFDRGCPGSRADSVGDELKGHSDCNFKP